MDKKKSVCKSLTLFYSFLRDVVVSKRRFQATKTRKDNDMCTHTHTQVFVRCHQQSSIVPRFSNDILGSKLAQF